MLDPFPKMMQTFLFRYFVPGIQPVSNVVLDDSIQEYNQDLVLIQGTEVVYWKLLEVNTYLFIFSDHCRKFSLYQIET